MDLRRELWSRGLRYRIQYKQVSGTPDIAFPGKKVAIFCDSDFWHGRFYREGRYIPKTNAAFWTKKLEDNIARDERVNRDLTEQGWQVCRIWESDIRADVGACADRVQEALAEYTHD